MMELMLLMRACGLVVAALLLALWASALAYVTRDAFAGFFHGKLGWHRPDGRGHMFDASPGSMDAHGHAYCRHCGERIIPASSYGDWMLADWSGR